MAIIFNPIHKQIVIIFFKIWSDDFDPNNSVKSNRQSVWVKTLISIFARLIDGTKVTYTYPISTAPKGVCHDEVDIQIYNELQSLRTGCFLTFFCRFMLKPIYVHADIFCMLADQPERRTLLNLSAGDSINHKRFGYLLDYQKCKNVILPCNQCHDYVNSEVDKYINKYDKILDDESNLLLATQCLVCSNWMLFDDHPLLKYEPDKNYPITKLDANGQLKLRKIT